MNRTLVGRFARMDMEYQYLVGKLQEAMARDARVNASTSGSS